MSSRFFRGGDDSSSESSSEEEDLLTEEEEEAQDQQEDSDEDSDDMEGSEEDSDDSDDSEGGRKGGADYFLKGGDSSDSEESDEEVRAKVKSAKDKRLDELEAMIKQIENGQKNGDWTLISSGMCYIFIDSFSRRHQVSWTLGFCVVGWQGATLHPASSNVEQQN